MNRIQMVPNSVLLRNSKKRKLGRVGRIFRVKSLEHRRSILLRYSRAPQSFTLDDIGLSIETKIALFGTLPRGKDIRAVKLQIAPAWLGTIWFWIKHDQVPGIIKSVGAIGGFVTVIVIVYRMIHSLVRMVP